MSGVGEGWGWWGGGGNALKGAFSEPEYPSRSYFDIWGGGGRGEDLHTPPLLSLTGGSHCIGNKIENKKMERLFQLFFS